MPILVASREFKPIERVLVAFDGGVSIDKAIDYLATAHAAFAGLALTLLRVGERTANAQDRIGRAAALLSAAATRTPTVCCASTSPRA